MTSEIKTSLTSSSSSFKHMKSENGVTVEFPEVKANKLNGFKSFSLEEIFNKRFLNGKDVIKTTFQKKSDDPDFKTIYAQMDNGLVGSILRAYSEHIPLSWRPDDLWIAIMINFGYYVSANSDSMRQYLVSHEGRKEISVSLDHENFNTISQEHLEDGICQTVDIITANTKNMSNDSSLSDWVIPSFSTTTANDRLVAQVVLMGVVKDYFSSSYELGCGLPQITLNGTLEDWQKLREKVEVLKTFNQSQLTDWAIHLGKVLDQLVATYEGKVDTNFWQYICTAFSRGSGHQKNYRGWFMVFCPFKENGTYLINKMKKIDPYPPKDTTVGPLEKNYFFGYIEDDEIPACKIDVPVVFNKETIEEVQTTLHAGFMTTLYNETTNVLRPGLDLVLVVNSKVTLEDLLEKVDKYYANNIKKCDTTDTKSRWYQYNVKEIERYEKGRKDAVQVTKFAYYLTKVFNMPNDAILELENPINNYVINLHGTAGPDYAEFVETLNPNNPRNYYSGRNFYKYIVPDRVLTVIAEYMARDTSTTTSNQ